MASLPWWMWVWLNSWIWGWTGRPGVLRFMGLQRVGHDWVTELNWIPYSLLWYTPRLLCNISREQKNLSYKGREMEQKEGNGWRVLLKSHSSEDGEEWWVARRKKWVLRKLDKKKLLVFYKQIHGITKSQARLRDWTELISKFVKLLVKYSTWMPGTEAIRWWSLTTEVIAKVMTFWFLDLKYSRTLNKTTVRLQPGIFPSLHVFI